MLYNLFLHTAIFYPICYHTLHHMLYKLLQHNTRVSSMNAIPLKGIE